MHTGERKLLNGFIEECPDLHAVKRNGFFHIETPRQSPGSKTRRLSICTPARTLSTTGGNTRSYEPYAVADARLTYGLSPRSLPWRGGRSARRRALSVSGIVLHIDANNILNTTYVDYGNVPQPGFWFAAGATVKME